MRPHLGFPQRHLRTELSRRRARCSAARRSELPWAPPSSGRNVGIPPWGALTERPLAPRCGERGAEGRVRGGASLQVPWVRTSDEGGTEGGRTTGDRGLCIRESLYFLSLSIHLTGG